MYGWQWGGMHPTAILSCFIKFFARNVEKRVVYLIKSLVELGQSRMGPSHTIQKAMSNILNLCRFIQQLHPICQFCIGKVGSSWQ